VVAHLIAGEPLAEGDTVEVRVDARFRDELSAGHTGCHLASLALDAALADAWRKDAPVDALGAPGFDALAIQESRILSLGSRDVYRIGKSLRRKGFDPTALEDLEGLAGRVNALLAEWVTAGGAVGIECGGATLADRRTWVCDLPGAVARIPCGGTHVRSLSDLTAIEVSFQSSAVEGGAELVMTTTVTPA
jgi:alanyl-tRNA synthetase